MHELWESVARRLDSDRSAAGASRLWAKLEAARRKGGLEAIRELLETLVESPEAGGES